MSSKSDELQSMTIHHRLGDENLRLLVDEFYSAVYNDNRISHLFANDIDKVKAKQFAFLSQFFGGPPRYAEQHGHPRLRMRHAPHSITKDGAMAWLENMALAISKLPVDEGLKDEIFNRFPQAAAHMVNS